MSEAKTCRRCGSKLYNAHTKEATGYCLYHGEQYDPFPDALEETKPKPQKCTLTQLAAYMGTTTERLAVVVDELGLPRRRGYVYNSRQVAQIVEAMKRPKTVSVHTWATRHGISVVVAKTIARELGVPWWRMTEADTLKMHEALVDPGEMRRYTFDEAAALCRMTVRQIKPIVAKIRGRNSEAWLTKEEMAALTRYVQQSSTVYRQT